ncbi:MAG: hypothetical protein Q7J07_11350, partial [Pelolinea sp.]|nr:hypothetical protein [Pelolinea sp.]
QTIREQLTHYPQDTLDAIWEAITKLTAKKLDAERTEGEHADAQKKSKHYAWLKQAIDLYEKRESLALPKYNLVWLVLSGLCLAAFLGLMIGYGYGVTEYWMGVMLAGMVGGAAVYIFNQNKLLRHRDAFEDINDIKQAYKEKFGTALSGLSALKAAQEEINAHYFTAKTLQESLERTKKETIEIETDLINYFLLLTGKKISLNKFEDTYAQLKSQKKDLEDALGRLVTQLEVLDVLEEDFLEEGAGVEYSRETHEETRCMLEEVRAQISEEDNALAILKQGLCDETGNTVKDDWGAILDVLREKRNSLYETRKALKADIIAQILVNQSLDMYREKEDEKIREGLASEKLVEALYQITGKYNKIELVGDELMVSDKYAEYPFSDLSTGTQEQIFLALRIGFAAKISKNDSLFFILDDAFQYSDWERRELLVDKVVDLAKHDWQVIYFSMDDHIRDLFVKKAGKAFKDDFKLITIDAK